MLFNVFGWHMGREVNQVIREQLREEILGWSQQMQGP